MDDRFKDAKERADVGRRDLDRCLAMMPDLHRVEVRVPRSCWDWPSYVEPSGYAVVKWTGPGLHIDRHVLCNSISGEISTTPPAGQGEATGTTGGQDREREGG